MTTSSATAAASAQPQFISKEDALSNNLIECYRRSQNMPVHPVIKEVSAKLSIEFEDIKSEEDCKILATQMYQLISKKYDDQFEIIYKDQDNAFSLEELLEGCFNRQFLVQVGSKTHRLHGFPMTPLDNFLHDLLHIYTAKVYPIATQVMRKLYEDMKQQRENNSDIYKKFITASFLIMHEMVSDEKSQIKKQDQEPYFNHLFDFLQEYKMFVVRYFSLILLHKFYFTTDEQGAMLSNENLLQQVSSKEEVEIVSQNEWLFRVRMSDQKEFAFFTFSYFFNDARDLLWRLKQCNMASGIEPFNEIQKADRETQVHWIKMIHSRQVKIIEDVFHFLQEHYSKPRHPMAQWFQSFMQVVRMVSEYSDQPFKGPVIDDMD